MRTALAFLLGAALPALALDPPPPYFENAVQDGQGTMWAYSRGAYDQIFSFDGVQWTEHGGPFRSDESAMPAAVARMTDGSVACVWRVEPHTVGVTRQTANGSTLLGICDGNIPGSGLTVAPFADSKNRLWITGEFPQIYRADGSGVKLVHQIAPGEYISPNPHPDGYNKVHAIEDGHGRVWVWSDRAASNYSSLRGVLIFTGDTPEMHASFGAIQGTKVLAIARADDRHMWVSVAGDGIYQVDIDAFTAQREPDPAPKALCCVHELQVAGPDLYAVEDQPVFKHALWRRHGGAWTKVVDSIGAYPFLPRSWLQLPNGMLVEGDEKNAWFIPNDGPAADVSWRSGFALQLAHAFFRLSNGDIFALGGEGKIFHAPLTLPPRDETNSRLVFQETMRGWTPDGRGHVWAITKAAPTKLSQWDGEKWIGYDIPGGIKPNRSPVVTDDTVGRLWLMPPMRIDPVRIFDLDSKTWRTYANLKAAYLALAKKPPQFLRTGVLDNDPVYGPHLKKAAYRQDVTTLVYYNGSAWQTFDRRQITGKNEGDAAIGPPWFNASGTLFVNIRNHTSWRMDAPGKWSQIPFQSHYPNDIWSEGGSPTPYRAEPPEGAITRHPGFCVKDNIGTYWFTWQGQLYRCVPGTCVAEFAPGDVNPFTAQRLVTQVFVDEKGNALFQPTSEGDPWLMIRPKSPAPQTEITLQRVNADSYAAQLDPKTTATGIVFRWQLDDGDWQNGIDRVLALDHLPNGAHMLRVTAMDANLDMQGIPTVAKFSTHINAASQIAELVAQLASPDYDQRKEAVDALARQPALAIPALCKARTKANEEGQWWIDVALQQAQEHQASIRPK